MRWNLRMRAAERGIWKSTQMRRLLADAGLEISAGKMSALWTGTPTTVRLDDLDIICAVLACGPSDLLTAEPDAAQAQRVRHQQAIGAADSGPASAGPTTEGRTGSGPPFTPRRPGNPRSAPPV